MKRSNQYESAFEAYLQERRVCYVAVDETRRAWLGDSRVKNLDFIIHGEGGARLLVDVKGRRYPAGPRGRRVWESWSTCDDIDGLLRWEALFGAGFRALLVFAYHIQPSITFLEDVPDLWEWQGRRYLLRAVEASAYRDAMRCRSVRWATVYLPGAALRELARPFDHYLQEPAGTLLQECPF